jgi:hypothetical protein
VGYLIYDRRTAEVHLDDRVLAHLQIVMLRKLRRGQSFAFSWKEPSSAGSGRSTIWVFPTVGLRFRFESSRPPVVDDAWIAALTRSADSSTGLQILPEPSASAVPASRSLVTRR